MKTASMWLAYQKSLTVPAYSVVSCTENPTPSLASTIRLLRQFGVLMSRSVSARSWTDLTNMSLLPLFSRADVAHGRLEPVQPVGQLVVGHRQRRHGLRALAVGARGLHQELAVERRAAHLRGQLTALERQPAR